MIAGLDRAVATMKKGEQAILTIHPDFGFGSIEARRDLAVVPPHSNIVFEVEMLDFIRVMIILMKLWDLKQYFSNIFVMTLEGTNFLFFSHNYKVSSATTITFLIITLHFSFMKRRKHHGK